MPKVKEGYEKKSAHLGLRFTEPDKQMIEKAVSASGKKTNQNALEPVIISWAKRILRHKGAK